MATIKKTLQTCLILFLAAIPGFSQSLLQDANALAECIEILENSASPDDTAAVRAKADLIAILHHYDKSYAGEAIVAGSWEELKLRYASNPLISGLFGDSVSLKLNDEATFSIAQARQFESTVDKGAREMIMEKLYAKEVVSPADYLSVNNVIQRYRTPVFPPIEALQITAGNSNRNAPKGILNSEAAIIEGLALFILDRARDEVIINYFDRLLKEETPDLLMLFPTVTTEFGNADFSYSDSFVARLRQAFYEDLQKMSVRLPLLLVQDEYFESLQADPVAYNLLALYSLVSLVQFDMPIEEAVPATNRYLYESFAEKTKEVNLKLAETAFESLEYQELIRLSKEAVDQMKEIYLALNNGEADLLASAEDFPNSFPNAAPAPFLNEYLDKPNYNLDVLLGEGNEFGLNLLPQLLQGELDSAYMDQYNTLESYDKFFGVERTAQQWRGAGIELAQRINGAWFNDQSIADVLYEWQSDLVRYQAAVDRWMQESDPEGTLARAQEKFAADVAALRQAIADDKDFWMNNASPTRDQRLAFNALGNLLTDNKFQNIEAEVDLDVLDELIAPDENLDVIKLQRKMAHFDAVELRFFTLDTLLYARHPDLYLASPSRKYLLGKQQAAPFSYIRAQIYELENTLGAIQEQLGMLEKQFAEKTVKGRDNARPILQTTELASNIMYCLHSGDPAQKWITHEQLDGMLDGGRKEAAFLGLMQQRLSRTNGVGLLSASGLADFARQTVKEIPTLPDPAAPDSIKALDTLAFFRKASFALNMLNRLLEIPLVADASKPGKFVALNKKIKGLEQIPAVSEQTLNFIYNLNIKDHGRAISSLIRVFTSLDLSEIESKGGEMRKPAIHYLQKYGDFIAGLIDARTSYAVENLMHQIADPPGSSRVKRTSPLSVSINAYLGGNFGQETWSGETLGKDEEFVSLAPTMPIGISISRLFGQKRRSYSLFISFLDIGSILTYQPQSVKSIDTDLTFKNMFKPGLQLHNNIRKSPFYWGVGWQYGPQFVEINKQEERIGANRFFIGFGVDVPVKTLYQK